MMGLGRGGTSATAAVVDAIGVPVGTSNDGHFETPEFKHDIDDPPKWKATRAAIASLNKRHAKWGSQIWNNPESAARIAAEVRNPHLLIVFRDPVAITERRLSLPDEAQDPRDLLAQVFTDMRRLLHHLAEVPVPTMLVSFERLRIQPAEIVPQIADFMGVSLTVPLLREALARVNLKGGYLVQTR